VTIWRELDIPLLFPGPPGILVVEDDPAIAYAITCLLDDRYQLYLAQTGEKALALFQRQRDIALVLLDYRLPDMSGLEVLQKIKSARPSLPVIFITGHGSEDVAIKAFTMGAKDYIRKPFTYMDLSAKVEFGLSLNASPRREHARRTVARPPVGLVPNRDDMRSDHRNYHKIQKAVKYIEDNFASSVTLEAAASRACISPYHFSREFKAITGTTFKHYLVNLRIEKAKEILAQGSLKVSDIGYAVGYDEPAHFVKIFKKRTGCTPTEYRRSQAAVDPDPKAS